MKIIFLDIDGCLNSYLYYIDDRNPGNLNGQEGDIDPLCVERVLHIVKETESKIVISSDWRSDWERTLTRLEKMGLTRDIVIDKTPELIWTRVGNDYLDEDGYEYSRGREIDLWLQGHPECEDFVIIDDRTDFTEQQQARLVRVNSYCGLTDDDTDKAIALLNRH